MADCLAGRALVASEWSPEWADFIAPCERTASEFLAVSGEHEMVAICSFHRRLLQDANVIPAEPQEWV